MLFKRALTAVYELDELFRFHQLGFVSMWPLLGLASTADWSIATALALVAVAFFFNSFGVVLNDVVDLPVDLTAPLRRCSTLVRGLITRRQALALSLIQLPLMLATHAVAGLSWHALPLLLAVTVCLAVYDLWSKTSSLPLLLDASLALSGYFFVLYGARVTERPVPDVAWPIALSAAAFLLYVNAFSNGLRDIENDLACGRRTTPIWFGCRGIVDGRVHITLRMYAYCALLQALLIGLAVSVVVRLTGPAWQDAIESSATKLVVLAALINAVLFLMQYNIPQRRWGILMRVHLLILPLPLMLGFAPQLETSGRVVLYSIYFGVVIVLLPLMTGGPRQPAPTAPHATAVQSTL